MVIHTLVATLLIMVLLTHLLKFILILILTCAFTECKRHSKKHRGTLVTVPEWKARRNKNSECRLGGSRYSLNSTWSPNLGAPFGVWGCVRCTCKPVQKKRRVVARVFCRNIKKQCPKSPCDDPVLAPGACCKLCPGQLLDFVQDINIQKEESIEHSELPGKDFAVLLNGRTSITPLTTSHLATGRIFLRRGTLHFSFVLEKDTPFPTVVQFLKSDGNIVEEIEVRPTPYEINNGRVCGTWTRVPRQYRNLLKKEELWVALVADNEYEAISGKIRRYTGISTEVFSSLLSPDKSSDSKLKGGGTAIISVSAPSDSLHISLIFNGIFSRKSFSNVSVIIELIPSRALEPVREEIYLEKVYSDLNHAEVMTTLGETSLRLLTRGKVRMKIWATSAPELYLEGAVIAKATCNVYSAVLSSTRKPGVSRYGAGWALLFVSNDGDFVYQMKLENLPTSLRTVVFETTGRRKVREVEDLTSNHKHGWVNGTYGRPTYRDLDMLLRGRLDVSVTMNDGDLLMGSFQSVSVTEALRSMYPILLRSSSFWMAASAWVAVDSACVMHYDVYLSGSLNPLQDMDPTWTLVLKENDHIWDPRLQQNNITLEHIITGREIAAHTTLLSKVSLTRLQKGASYLQLSVSDSPKPFFENYTISGEIKGVNVPNHCTINPDSHRTSLDRKIQGDRQCSKMMCLNDQTQEQDLVQSIKCIDSAKRVYEDGARWISPNNLCHKCLCDKAVIKCQPEPCPKLTCANNITRPGDCCPSCPVDIYEISQLKSKKCIMDKNEYNLGSSWHPFLSPDGFFTCVTCNCTVNQATKEPMIMCNWIKCPKLSCPEKLARTVKGQCCRQCPIPANIPSIQGMISDRNYYMTKTEAILANGGCIERQTFSLQEIPHRNGERWEPNINNKRGKLCVYCTCKDGKITCSSDECRKNTIKHKNKKSIKQKRKGRKNRKKKKFLKFLSH